MNEKTVLTGKKDVPFLQSTTGQIALLAATSVFSGFCMAVGGGIYNKLTGTTKAIATRDENVVIDLPVRTPRAA